jgi:nucleoid DNA-binding protein
MTDAASKSKPLTKAEIVAALVDKTNLPKADVVLVLDAMCDLIRESVSASGPGTFMLPGLLKIERKEVPAKPARLGVPNPFKPGETRDIPAKPASVKIRMVALKSLKESAQPPASGGSP